MENKNLNKEDLVSKQEKNAVQEENKDEFLNLKEKSQEQDQDQNSNLGKVEDKESYPAFKKSNHTVKYNNDNNSSPSLYELWLISLFKLIKEPYAMLVMILTIGTISGILGSVGDPEMLGGLIPVIVLLMCLTSFFTWVCLTFFPIFLLKKEFKEDRNSPKFKQIYKITENAIFILMAQINFRLLKTMGIFIGLILFYLLIVKPDFQFSYLSFYQTPILIFLVYSVIDILFSLKNSHLKTEFLAFLMFKDKLSMKNMEYQGKGAVSLNKKEIEKASMAFGRFLDKNKVKLYLNSLSLLIVWGMIYYFSVIKNDLNNLFIVAVSSIFLFVFNILFNITLFEFFEEENKDGYKEKNGEEIVKLTENEPKPVAVKIKK